MSGKVCIVGKFESFHIGHQKLIEKAHRVGDRVEIISIWLPIEEDNYVPLFTLDERIEIADGLDVGLTVLDFKKVRDKTPEEFFYMLKSRGCSSIVVGVDWRFGRSKSGDVNLALKLGKVYGIDVFVVDPVFRNGVRVGTSLIRDMLSGGNIRGAAELLGFYYFCKGVVIRGRGIGKKIGYPTVNVNCAKSMILKNGVYCVFLECGDSVYRGVANLGVRPTFFKEGERLLEIHIPDSDVMCEEGSNVKVRFVDYVREERKFPSVEPLRRQISQDLVYARRQCWSEDLQVEE